MCPRCGSKYLLIRHATGKEWLLVLLTGRRKHKCEACGYTFRTRQLQPTDSEPASSNSQQSEYSG
jgi:rubredoxin